MALMLALRKYLPQFLEVYNLLKIFFMVEDGEATTIHENLQATLSNHQGEMTILQESCDRFKDNADNLRDTSELINRNLLKITEEVGRLGGHAAQMEKVKLQNIGEFQKAFEEQSKSVAEKLVADMTNLMNIHILA